MGNNALKASASVDFSLIGVQLHTMYEGNEGGYAILLIPSEQAPDSGISVKNLIDDIKKTTRGVTGSDTAVDTTQLEKAMTEAAKEGGSTSMRLEDIVIRLQVAYLYICKEGENSVLEYAFQLQVVTEGLVSGTTKPIMDVMSLFISVWDMDRRKVVDKMTLATVDEYLGVAVLLGKSQTTE